MEFWEKQRRRRMHDALAERWAENNYAYRHQDNIRIGNEEISISSDKHGIVNASVRTWTESGEWVKDETLQGYFVGELLRRLRHEVLTEELWAQIRPKLTPLTKAPSGIDLAIKADEERKTAALKRKEDMERFWEGLARWAAAK